MGFRPFFGLSGCGGAFADAADALRFAVFAALKNACSAAPAAVPLMPDAVFEAFCAGIVIHAGPDVRPHAAASLCMRLIRFAVRLKCSVQLK
ncbi:hypothetical protein NLK90_27485, partial [Klebsiella pneumoniae]|uniref:hypothetical protein n=1 Tax=Klebsiella pneumoniae TaxID=573 RepID=UPI0021D0BD85